MCKSGKFSSPPQYLKSLIMTLLDRNPTFTECFSCLCMNKTTLASKESAIQYALPHHFCSCNFLPYFQTEQHQLGKKKKKKAMLRRKPRIILKTIQVQWRLTKWGRFAVHHNKWANLKTDTSYLNKRLLNYYLCFCFKKSEFSLKL